MTAVIVVYNANGDVVGRCDATCHEATSADCDCICGGHFHGIGDAVLALDVRSTFENALVDHKALYADRIGYTPDELRVKFPLAEERPR